MINRLRKQQCHVLTTSKRRYIPFQAGYQCKVGKPGRCTAKVLPVFRGEHAFEVVIAMVGNSNGITAELTGVFGHLSNAETAIGIFGMGMRINLIPAPIFVYSRGIDRSVKYGC